MVVHDRKPAKFRAGAEVTAEGDLRVKNQVTVPKAIADFTGLQPGDWLLFIVDPQNPDVMQVHRIRTSYAGVLAGLYGTPEEVRASLREEEEAWGE